VSGTKIHPTAIVDSSAIIGADVEVGPYCIVGPHVELKDRVRLVAHVFIEQLTQIGEDTVVHPFAVLGGPPQDISYRNEPTRLVIGQRNEIREHVTMHRGTIKGRRGGLTLVGDDGYFMAHTHVAHDATVGDHTIFSHGCMVGGHTQVADYVIMGAASGLHQHCRVGRHAILGGIAAVVEDVIPYGSVLGNQAHLAGLNVVGLRRRNFSREQVNDLRAAYRLLFAEEGTFQERVDDVARLFAHRPEVMEIIDFIRADDSKRPLCMPLISHG
jgi:UDP-N-acetylglucosamine acyltransferase